MSKNVMIPLSLMNRAIDLLGYLEPMPYHELRHEHNNVLQELMIKKQKLELREAYAKIISAKNEADRHDARIEYLMQKRSLRHMELVYGDAPI
jgi:hypothetical protein